MRPALPATPPNGAARTGGFFAPGLWSKRSTADPGGAVALYVALILPHQIVP